MQSMTNVILSLRDVVSEPVRCLIARRFAAAIHSAIVNEDVRKRYLKVGMPHFLRACEVQDGDPFVPDDLNVETTKLARFCDRWMTVEAFRKPEGDWTPITDDMNALRYTMVTELQALAEEQLKDAEQIETTL